MYRQILIDPRDANYQRILWTDHPANPVKSYQLVTVTYGTASAPFLALRVIQQLIQDEGATFPLAVPVLHDNIYVDDVLFGADDIPMLRQTRDQVRALLQQGKFQLRKWASNSPILLRDIAEEDHGLTSDKQLRSDEQLKILGISWNPAADKFRFRVSLPLDIPTTKRSILSNIAKLFDPLGWSTPAIVTAKIFLQRLWQVKLNWDEQLPSHLQGQWESIQLSLSALNDLSIDRWTQFGSDTVKCEIHGFSDASTAAYAAVIYLRLTSISGQTESRLLIGKSKVAPIKSQSIPRLELSAAVLLSRLIECVRTTLSLTSAPCYCWTDSTVVLAWIHQHSSKWKTFVANRVSEIQSRLPFAVWRHVPTDDNPADCASRGIDGSRLHVHGLWWRGPAWLRLSRSEWPTLMEAAQETTLETSPARTVHLTKPKAPWDLASKFSSWPLLIRVTAYVLRFVARLRRSTDHLLERAGSPALSANECRLAREFWLKRIQEEVFPAERETLLQKKSLSSKSALLALHPFVGEDKLIRVGGRLTNAPLSFPIKYPVILASHPLVNLIIRHAHLRSLHAGPQLTLATIRREFWILRARDAVKSVIHRCVTCTPERATAPMQLMGSLPCVRVSKPARAFLHCGVDYAGLVLIRASSGRGIASRKTYISVFVCMASRAVHLELVEGYSTSAFMGAFSRFCARRGLPQSMYSDNGTTFVGAERELTSAFRAATRDPNLLNRLAADNIEWHFIPPSAPHSGGLWEAGVHSMKHHIRRVPGDHTFTFEEFATLLCNIEACLNSRLLAPLTDTMDDYEPLTPGHFLIGAALTAHPEPSMLNVSENRLSRWQLVRQLTERFWKLWQTDYINTLQQRAKWRRVAKDIIKIGQLVLLKNSGLSPCKWEMGRIIQCHAGPDGLIRVVTIQTAASAYKRPISKICLLPIDLEREETSS